MAIAKLSAKRASKPQRQGRERFNLYLVKNLVTGEKYVGIARNRSVFHRWNSHLSTARSGRGYALHNAIREWGEDAFECEHIACAFDHDGLIEAEKTLIEQYDCYWPNGYNRTQGGGKAHAIGDPISFEGRQYNSWSELAAEYGFSAYSIHQRVKRYRWSLRQALELDPVPKRESSPFAKRVLIGGKEYPSLKAAGKALGVSEANARVRMKKYGWTLEEAFGVVAKKRAANPAQKRIVVAGIEYPSRKQAAVALGVAPSQFASRLRLGWSPEEAANLVPKEKPVPEKATIIVGGKQYKSVEHAAAAYPHIPLSKIKTRLRGAFSPDEAFELVIRTKIVPPKIGTRVTLDGREFHSLSEAARAFDLPNQLVNKRMRRWGWSLEQAFGLAPPPRRTRRASDRGTPSVQVNGTAYESLMHACEALGQNYRKVSDRIKRGWSLDEAFGVIYRKPKTRSA